MTTTTSPADLRALGAALRRWAGGGRVGVVRVLDRHGFGTVEPAQLLAANPAGERAGEVYRGALDEVALPLAAAAVGAPATRLAHVDDGPAYAAGLACAGGATLLGHPLPAPLAAALGTALAEAHPAALVSTVDGGRALVLTGDGLGEVIGDLGGDPDSAVVNAVRGLLRRGASVTERRSEGGTELLVDLWVPVPSVLVVGAGAIGEALLAQAALLGWPGRAVTTLDDARAAVAGFSDADVLVLLDHDPAFDAVLFDGVRGGRGFIGALGSRHTQAERWARLTAAGLDADELARVYGPVGLDLGARTPAETAVSIVGQVIAYRAGRTGTALAAGSGRIGA